MKTTIKISSFFLLVLISSCNNKEPYTLPAYQAKAIVIGEEKCSADSNYNYWLLDLSIENTSSEMGDTITYNGVKYNHVFKAMTANTVLHKPGNKVEFKFNFLFADNEKIQSTTCDAPDAETFLLIGVAPFDVKQL